MRTAGCFHTEPPCGSTSPVMHLMSVDLPAPLGPCTTTRDDSEMATDASLICGVSRPGYVYDAFMHFRMALSLERTPSRKPGSGKENLNCVADSS